MADLKDHLQSLKLEQIQTYIQSGNIVFKYKKTKPEILENKIAKKIHKEYGFDISVKIIDQKNFKKAVVGNIFPAKKLDRVYVSFLSKKPSLAKIKSLQEVDFNPEEYQVKGEAIYFYSPEGYKKGKLNNNFFEKKLDVIGTTRNWKTVIALVKLFEEMGK